MATIAEHYDTHLAEHYSWLFGGLPNRVAENRSYFEKLGLGGEGRAIDLGCGSGFQAIPLAQLGYQVTAVDLSKTLLGELAQNAKGLSITPANDDILHWLTTQTPASAVVAVCMGDTLTHLLSFGEVQRVFRDVYRVLEPRGRFILAFRDLTEEIAGLDRFIPVRSDANTVMMCFLEYEGDHVRVNDIIQVRHGDAWETKKSAYRKLRISGDWAKKRAIEVGFSLESAEERQGMVTLVLRRP